MLSFTGKGIKFPAGPVEEDSIRVLPPPAELWVPLCPPTGEATRLAVSTGAHVERFSPLAEGETLSVYAPFSGQIAGFAKRQIAGNIQLTARLLPDAVQPETPVYATVERPALDRLVACARAAAIPEGFSNQPLFERLAALSTVRRLLVCTVDEGPDMRSSGAVLMHYFREISSAAGWLAAGAGLSYSFVVGNPYSRAWIKSRHPDAKIRLAGRRYPVRYFLQKEVGKDALLLDAVSLLHLFRAVAYGRPAVSSFVSVSEGGSPSVWEVPVGTPAGALFGSALPEGRRMIAGGGMRGFGCTPSTPVALTTAALSLLPAEQPRPTACIGCGLCCKVCPTGVYPVYVQESVAAGESRAAAYGVDRCIGCGACTYICPARLPLARTVQSVQAAMGEEDLNVR